MAQFWKPSSSSSLSSSDRDSKLNPVVSHRHKNLPIYQQRQILPIFKYKNHILYALENYQTIILVSETGSGKSTQVPQYLHEAGWAKDNRCIVCTQPRRMAARTVSSRVADEMGVKIGEEVGYSVRFDSNVSSNTAIKYCTDGVLLRETMSDPLLSKYSVIIVDEAHERSLQSDILLGLLKKIIKKRKELRIIITSATLNASDLKDFFETNNNQINNEIKNNEIKNKDNKNKENKNNESACILSVQGRQFPVDIQYLSAPCHSYVQTAVDTVLNIHKKESKGDILLFLPGGEEIDTVVDKFNDQYEGSGLYFIPLYSSLPVNMQMRAFEVTPIGMRKVVISTNIAETSITIEGIKYVVDAGFVKLNYFDVHTGIEALVTCPISKSAATQRSGRAGRTAPGKCFRLMTEISYEKFPDYSPPEMNRVDISGAILQLKALGIDDVLHFDFLSPPSSESMIYSLELLYSLSALDIDCKLTAIGEKMAEMPVEPRLSKSLLDSYELGCGEEMLTIAAMCAVENPFLVLRSKASQESKKRRDDCLAEFVSLEGDHLTLLNVFNSFIEHNYDAHWCDSMCLQHRILARAKEVRGHLYKMLKRFGPEGGIISSCGDDTVAIRKSLISGYFANAAQLGSDGKYRTLRYLSINLTNYLSIYLTFLFLRGQTPVSPHHTSVIARFGALPEWVVFNDVVHSKQTLIREITAIQPRWLMERAQHYYSLSKK
jgi:ATP-dependent RNA helicase DDX35